MNRTRKLKNKTQLIQKGIATVLLLTLHSSFASANAITCENIFFPKKQIIEKVQDLIDTQIRLKIGALDHIPGVKAATETAFRAQLSEMFRQYPTTQKIYMNKLKQNLNSLTQVENHKKHQRDQKESKIENQHAIKKLLEMKYDEQFNNRALQVITSLSPENRDYLVNLIRNEWTLFELNSPEKNFASRYFEILENTIHKGNFDVLKEIIDLKLFSIHDKNESGLSILLAAEYAEQTSITDWILQQKDFDINAINPYGVTDVEFLRLINKVDRAQAIEQARPDVKSRSLITQNHRKNKTKYYPQGSPSFKFVKVPPGSFRMGDKEKVSITITKPFEIFSTQTTQDQWKQIVQLIEQYLPGQYKLDPSPNDFKGALKPVGSVRYKNKIINSTIEKWLQALNQLSQLNHPELQYKLTQIFPDHQFGDHYNLPTEAQWEYVARMLGYVSGKYPDSYSGRNFDQYAWVQNPPDMIAKVGLKEPIFIMGEPVYGMSGHVHEWVLDNYSEKLVSAIDPLGPPETKDNAGVGVHRGGYYLRNEPDLLHIGHRQPEWHGGSSDILSFRMTRTR